ncbi:MotA/TolQ/ExbB proton channel family protein [Amphibiibacter pelophylacis]|uniref:MotA/TolQ/ExbB proton channel family protein n=1 Tax=Amphibiibacter pelophylacis TaxID=1799477 RepID=A0ACC6NZ60_9BURK
MFAIIQAAGWPIWPLLLASVLTLAFVIERAIFLRRPRIAPPKLLDDVLGYTRRQTMAPSAVQALSHNSLLGQVLAGGLQAHAQSWINDEARQQGVRQGFERAGRDAIAAMERYLGALGTLASAAPLLGLLGTVIGMIEIFTAQGAMGSSPAQLASGIAVALYNTALGLLVAIPALVAHRYFRARVNGFIAELENASERLYQQLMLHSPEPAVSVRPAAPAA